MATATLFGSFRRRHISSPASLLPFKSLGGAKTSGNGSYSIREFCYIMNYGSWKSHVIGIDLGTTKSRVAVMEGEIPKVIRNVEGSLSTPSVVSFNHKGEVIVGTLAKHQAVTKPKNTVFGAKRLIGRRFDDLQTQKEMKTVPYNIVKALNGDAWIEANGQEYSPSQIAAFVFAKLKETAEDYLLTRVIEAVISVPSFFNDAQRQATRDAARIAGLKVLKIINDHEAAATSYALGNIVYTNSPIVVVDLGGGTFDVSVLKLVDSFNSFHCEIVAQHGDTSLGGDDFDAAIVDFLISEFKRSDGIDLTGDIVAVQRLREAAEWAKIELSTEIQTEIDLPSITTDANGAAKHLNITLTRSEFEAQVKHLIERMVGLCEKCIKDANYNCDEAEEVIIAGGMSRVPIVQETVTEIFDRTPLKALCPDEVVATGASYHWWVHSNYQRVRAINRKKQKEEGDYNCSQIGPLNDNVNRMFRKLLTYNSFPSLLARVQPWWMT